MTSEQFERCAEECRAGLFVFCSKLSPQPDDLVQDTLIRAWVKREQFAVGRSFFSWVCTIAQNIAKDHKRKESRRVQTVPCSECLAADPAEFQEGLVIDAATILAKESPHIVELVRRRFLGEQVGEAGKKELFRFRGRVRYFDPRIGA